MTDETTDEKLRRLRQLRAADVAELANVFYQSTPADQLLSRAGFSRATLPPAGTAMERWRSVNNELGNGEVPGGRRRILEAAVNQYEANRVFQVGLAQAIEAEAEAARLTEASAAGPAASTDSRSSAGSTVAEGEGQDRDPSTRGGNSAEGGSRGDLAEERQESAEWDFFVSAATEDEDWAAWITWWLEQKKYRVRYQAWDTYAGDVEANALDEAIRGSRRTVVVLSPAYLRAERVQAAWQRAWHGDPNGLERRLIPVRVEECKPEGLLRGIVYVDLVGLEERAARTHLVEQIARSVQGSYRPRKAPPFPIPKATGGRGTA